MRRWRRRFLNCRNAAPWGFRRLTRPAPVSDYMTREMMTAYYTGLRDGLGRGDALRHAKLAMLKRHGRQPPFYWASFIQSGEWADLNGRR